MLFHTDPTALRRKYEMNETEKRSPLWLRSTQPQHQIKQRGATEIVTKNNKNVQGFKYGWVLFLPHLAVLPLSIAPLPFLIAPNETI